MTEQQIVKKNERYTVEIVDLSYEGMGVAKIDGYPLFIENALPGEEVEILVVKAGNKFGYGKVETFITQSPDRQPVENNALLRIGIAPLAHLKYEQQLVFKQKQVEHVMAKIAKMPEVPVLPTVGMAEPFGYRNKAQIPVRRIDGQLATGFYKKNSHDLVPIEDFYIQDPVIDQAIKVVRDILQRFQVRGYNEEKNEGQLRHIIIRRGHYSHEMMVVLVTRKEKFFKSRKLLKLFMKNCQKWFRSSKISMKKNKCDFRRQRKSFIWQRLYRRSAIRKNLSNLSKVILSSKYSTSRVSVPNSHRVCRVR